MLVFAFQSEIWIAQNFNFTVFEGFSYRCHSNIDFHKMQTTLKSLIQNQPVLQLSR